MQENCEHYTLSMLMKIYILLYYADILREFWFVEDKFIDFGLNNKIVDFGISELERLKVESLLERCLLMLGIILGNKLIFLFWNYFTEFYDKKRKRKLQCINLRRKLFWKR